jgi:hypothetical protein
VLAWLIVLMMNDDRFSTIPDREKKALGAFHAVNKTLGEQPFFNAV